jgi:RNA polymerase sigma factor (TIGR02999 family)
MDLTEQLKQFSEGDRDIAEQILRLIYPELHSIAVRAVGRERFIAPLQPTELIDEAWLRLQSGGWKIQNRAHFYSIAGRAMRQVLVDYARQRRAKRRGDGQLSVPLEGETSIEPRDPGDSESLIAIGLLMEKLATVDPEGSVVVDLHYFSGYSFEETADKTGWTLRQVRHRWDRATNWLKDRI